MISCYTLNVILHISLLHQKYYVNVRCFFNVEWEIGSSGTTPDIFPRVKIGTKKSTKAAIIDGHLWLDGVNINTTVKEYVLKNWTEEEIAKAHAHGNFFNFEPGRCIHVNLYSVNRAHLSSKIYVKPICMKRK